VEIERKFLVNKILWQQLRNPANSSFIQQAYLSVEPKCTVRIRIADNKATITIKGQPVGISREEFEYPVPLNHALKIIKMAETPVILKRRYLIRYKGTRWEIDEFYGDNEGLLVAEVELKSEMEQPEFPEWIDLEVTGDPRYFNLQLAINPINQWQ
jgi:adenylate cyclase